MMVARRLFLVGAAVALMAHAYAQGAGAAGDSAPVFDVDRNGIVNEWLVLGPLPNLPPEFLQGAVYRFGFATDFLTTLGGEPQAVIGPDTKISYTETNGFPATASVSAATTTAAGRVDLKGLYGKGEHVAYGFAYLASDREQTIYCLFGSNDCAKVWVNGELRVSFWSSGGRAFVPAQEVFPVVLKKGLNPVLVKVEDAGGSAWEFQLEVRAEARVTEQETAMAHASALKQFQYAELVPEGGHGYVLPLGQLPDFVWKDEAYVTSLVGNVPLTTTWYDAKWHKIKKATRRGRHAAVVEGVTPDAIQVRRAFTAYCFEGEWRPHVDGIRTYVHRLPAAFGVKHYWVEAVDQLDWTEFDAVNGFGGPAHAILLAAFDECQPCFEPLTVLKTPDTLDAEYYLTLRRKLGDYESSKLRLPRPAKGKAAPVLRVGTPALAGVKADTPERLDELFDQWYEETDEPFSVLIARHGVIILNQSYGPSAVNTENEFWVASVTKAVTALMFAQFVDQGLIDIDDPVGKYLPDFPVEGEKTITLRHCFTHTSGLSGHREWGGMMNPYLDNVIVNGLDSLSPGQQFEYNGMGIDLAGKVMEAVSGKSIRRLFEENFFAPLGISHASVTDLGGGLCCSSEDLARIGQMVANRGAYGDTVFFSPETFNAFLPRNLSEFYPGVDREWGVSLVPMRQPHPGAGANGIPANATLLSANLIGHGAASGTIFRVDLDNQLVIVQTRNDAGPDYEAYVERLMMVLDDSLIR